MTEERVFYLSIGICPICKTRPVEPHKRACYECLARERDRYYRDKENGKTKEKQKRDTKRKRELAEERRSKGLCPKCGKYPSIDGGLCKKCRAYQKRYRDAHRKDISRSERVSYGRCYICGKEELYKDFKVCKECYDTRLSTIPSLLSKSNHEYFSSLNNFIFKGGNKNE